MYKVLSILAVTAALTTVDAVLGERLLRGTKVARVLQEEEILQDEEKTEFGQEISFGESPVVSQEKYPFVINLSMGCSGTLIHHDIVLSSASCYTQSGEGYFLDSDDEPLKLEGLLSHPFYTQDDTEGGFNYRNYDFSLYRITEPPMNLPISVALNDHVEFSSAQEVLTVVGSSSQDKNLHAEEVTIHQTCDNYFEGQIVNQEQLCVSSGTDETCKITGPGGPVLNSKHEMVGVSSWAPGCGWQGDPGVVARVSYAAGWIDRHICESSEYPFNDCTQVHVELPYNEYFADTTWTLFNSHMHEVASVPLGSITDEGTVFYNYMLRPATYTLFIQIVNKDASGFGGKSIVLYDGVRTLKVSTKTFTTSTFTVTFEVMDPNQSHDMDKATADGVEIIHSVDADSFAKENHKTGLFGLFGKSETDQEDEDEDEEKTGGLLGLRKNADGEDAAVGDPTWEEAEETKKGFFGNILGSSTEDNTEEDDAEEVEPTTVVHEVIPEVVTEPTTETVVDEVTSEEVTEPATETVVDEVVSEVVTEPTTETVVDEVISEVVTEPATETVVDEVVSEVVTEPATETVVDEVESEVTAEPDASTSGGGQGKSNRGG